MSKAAPNDGRRLSDWDPERVALVSISVGLALLVIVLVNVISSQGGETAKAAGRWLVDYQTGKEDPPAGRTNYWAMQNFMWIAFFFGLADLLHRYRWTKREMAETTMDYLPGDDSTLLTSKDLPVIFRKVRTADRRLVLPRLIGRLIVQFQKSNSVEQSATLLNSSLELFLHELDLRYTLVRYANWIIPSLGFLGTVLGLAAALNYAGSMYPPPDNLLTETTLKLGVAFYTTGVALAMSSVLILAMNLVQAAEESALNRSGQYCLDRLINKLFEKKE